MTKHRLLALTVVLALAWPVVSAAAPSCCCPAKGAAPAPRGCCEVPKAPTPKKSCCEIVPAPPAPSSEPSAGGRVRLHELAAPVAAEPALRIAAPVLAGSGPPAFGEPSGTASTTYLRSVSLRI